MDLCPNDLNLILPQWSSLPPNVRAFSTTRLGGLSLAAYGDGQGGGGLNLGSHVGDDLHAVTANRAKLNALLPMSAIFLSQVHGDLCVDVGRAAQGQVADACFSFEENQVCAVLTADCLPILLCGNSGSCVAAVHAGWRGLAGRIVENSIAQLRTQGAGQLSAWMGPAIGASAFEVGDDVVQSFSHKLGNAARHFTQIKGSNKYLADIYGLARQILSSNGVSAVYGGEYCTVSERATFYSYRRDGVTGRMGSFIWRE